MGFTLGKSSRAKLLGVHPDLIKVVERAIQLTPVDFTVFEGVRSFEQQKKNVAKGVSKTLKSRHIPASNACKMACAVDLVPLKNGKPTWANEDIKPLYIPMSNAVIQAAKELGVSIEWGGDWKMRDYPHFELHRNAYPFAK